VSSAISLRDLTKSFASSRNSGDTSFAVDRVTLDVGENEFLTMIGPSGCGKSTLLRLIAGLETPTGGDICIDGKSVNDVPTRARNVGFIFQGYALFKHMTVANNIGFGLKIKRVPRKKRRHRIEELVSLMGLQGLEDRRPDQLSGGQQQRAALARALAPQPRILLLDEPFGAVDAKVRQKLRADTKRWQQELKIPTILVTHDQREALELGDRVAVMSTGRIEQIDAPRNVYAHPASEFVARVIGGVNVFTTQLGGSARTLTNETLVDIMVRPEDITVLPRNGYQQLQNGQIPGTVASYTFLGRTVRLEVQLNEGRLVTVAVPKNEALANRLEPGTPVALTMDPCQLLPLKSKCLRSREEA